MTRQALRQDDPQAAGDGPSTAVEALGRELASLRAEVAELRARLAEAEALAETDVLAPVLNRRGFERELRRAAAFAARYARPACLVYFDLDGFKAVNDRLGHAAGDAALKEVADRLASRVRGSDVVGRIGGDEFAVILLHTDLGAGAAKAAALARAISGDPVRVDGGSVSLTASFGVAELGAGVSAQAALAAADAAMFENKRRR